ncbi:MAG TPA: helix-hairpin-helix domain-containing protein [Cytophagales bacterium]|nr:helix-hairpin-helix domain-containing protein [Cytophagales bacterium]
MKRIRFWIQDYFGFSPTETTGFIVLMFLIFFLLILPPIIKPLLPVSDTDNADKAQLEALIVKLESVQTVEKTASSPSNPKYFSFNPNTSSEADFLSLGIDTKTARTIMNYRNKGGYFTIKSDFKKVYGLKEETYLRLYPYIDLPEKKAVFVQSAHSSKKKFKAYSPKEKEIFQPFDINKADSTQLIKINGIGNKLAQRILNYRNKLGGFIHQDQLEEVYGLDTVVVKRLKESSLIDVNFTPDKINVNTATLEELRQHPYISYKIAKTIIAYRDQHGSFNSLSALKNIHSISPQTFIKIEPYLTL